ncbi:MAG: hypothetical protein AMJ79_13575 [Phycisphaerae bacterium SM23_30]|nr:MAG: hypothetical protein AMJ79_13575 [Phycisphaerae bacterium SM23_30]
MARQVRTGAKKTARVLAVTSGKGGVGKTNVAANLAICLSAAGKDVILFDADLGLANLDVLLPVKIRFNLAHVIAGKRRLAEIVQPGPGGIRLVCGASGITQMADLTEVQRQRLAQEMTQLEYKADVIVIDTGAGISRNVLGFCQSADHTLVVTTTEPTSITDAYAVIKALNQGTERLKISLLTNMVENRDQAQKVYQRLAFAGERFLNCAIYDAGYVLRDNHLSQAVHQRKPVVLAFPRCPASYCFVALAQKLIRAGKKEPAGAGFFRKVINWFF